MMGSHSYGFGAGAVSLGTPTQLAASVTLSGSGSVASASHTPTANSMMYWVCGSRRNSSLPDEFVVTDSIGGGVGAWDQIFGATFNVTTRFLRLSVFRRQAEGSPAARTATILNTGSTDFGAYGFEITDAGADFSNTAFGTDPSGNPTATLGVAPSITSTTLAFYLGRVAGTTTTGGPTSYTNLADFVGGTAAKMRVSYRAANVATAASFTSSGQLDCIAGMIEVKV
jgi:hypothetical protein